MLSSQLWVAVALTFVDRLRFAHVVVTFVVGERKIIAGLSQGVEGMYVGGHRRLCVGRHLAYRDRGVPGIVPPNAKLIFDVESLAIE